MNTKYYRMIMCVVVMITSLASQSLQAQTQKVDDERMRRDIEVAENVLLTLIKQQMNQQNQFFGIDIRGSYVAGYGVTFKLPNDNIAPFFITVPGPDNPPVIYGASDNGYSYQFNTSDRIEIADGNNKGEDRLVHVDRAREQRRQNLDSVREEYYTKLIAASKDFILDYGDFISQLAPNEKIVITNQLENNRGWYFNAGKRTHVSIEAAKADITAYKQGKINREQALSKIKIVNAPSVETKSPDMELISSIFSRLYSEDLSKTYFTEQNIYYEVLKDYGVIYYMQVYSTNTTDYTGKSFDMPTLGLTGIDMATRDKKVTEIYPKFEQEMKENILEYGRTVKSLKDDEVLSFNITLTRCRNCGIPSTLELSIKAGVLKEFASGKIDKSAALSKFVVKKGQAQ